MIFRTSLLILLLISCLISDSLGFFGFGNKNKEKEKEEKKSAKDSVALGMDNLVKSSQDPMLLKEAMESLNDPETMKEVEKMMNDPEFRREVEKLKNDPHFVRSMLSAQDLYSDPQKAAKVMGQIKAQKAMEESEISDAQLGLSELAKAAKNPKMLAEAMEMLKDPEIAKEVEKMMADPTFKAEMNKLTESANFKSAMDRASEDIEMLSKDPVAMKRLKAKTGF